MSDYDNHNRDFWGETKTSRALTDWAQLRMQIRRYEAMLSLMIKHGADDIATEALCAKIAQLKIELKEA